MTTLSESTVAIVGLGLMGGSLAAALRGQCKCVTGVARRQATLDFAHAHNFIDAGTSDLIEGVRDADVVILGTPVRVIIDQLAEMAPHLKKGCVVMDLGSTKSFIVDAMDRILPNHAQPLGTHPMCGKETSGIEVAEATLYEGSTFILTPLARTSDETVALGRELAEAIGANPLVLDPDQQDYLVGTVSHLPYLLACSLIATADATTSQDPAMWKIVAGGYRDTSRVAGSDVKMMLDILMTNKGHVLDAIHAFEDQLRKLTRLIEAENEEALWDVLSFIRETRREMYP